MEYFSDKCVRVNMYRTNSDKQRRTDMNKTIDILIEKIDNIFMIKKPVLQPLPDRTHSMIMRHLIEIPVQKSSGFNYHL